jgi:hypothetical protein
MAGDQWLDSVQRTLQCEASRRNGLRVALALVAVILPLESHPGEARRKRQKKRQRKKRTRSTPPQPASSCSDGACAREFTMPEDLKHCEFICRQCDGPDPREFCIAQPDPFRSAIAVCCAEGKTCCGRQCCGPDQETPNRRCCDGACVDTGRNLFHCGMCGHRCPAGWACEERKCVCKRNCACPADRASCNEQCCDPDQWCYADRVCCPATSVPPGRVYTPACASIAPDQCIPDTSFVCCDGFGCQLGSNDPTKHVCCGRGEDLPSQRFCVASHLPCPVTLDRYAPLATHTYGEE